MQARSSGQVLVGKNVMLDGRLALFHRRERWLAVADLHFGYELSQRAAGNLFPWWGMQTIEVRLQELLHDYNPSRLIILGDLVHDGAARDEAAGLIKRLSHQCPIVIIAGNHDRDLNGVVDLTESWQTKRFHFHHGNCISKENDRLQIIGHYHPAGMLADGAGLHLKLPAFVQQDRCWIMPAFSPWAGGTRWRGEGQSRIWLCTPQRVLRLNCSDGAQSPSP